jgi:hypothetical protein
MRRSRTPKQQDEINQTKCWIATGGHIWMEGYFDSLPLSVRERLRDAPYNLCPACLVTKFMPLARAKYKYTSRTQALMRAIEIMEDLVRRTDD